MTAERELKDYEKLLTLMYMVENGLTNEQIKLLFGWDEDRLQAAAEYCIDNGFITDDPLEATEVVP